jgi:hypothetical protein
MRFSAALLLMSVLLGGVLVETARAQTPSNRGQRRTDLVEGILRTLIESQMDRQGQPGARRPPPGATAESPQMAEIRRSLTGFSQESAGLIAALRNEERYSPAIRPLLGDAITTKAAADVLLRKSQYVRQPQLIQRDVEELDRQWRILSHRLGQFPNLGAPSRAHIGRLNAYDQQLCRSLQIAPQLDLTALIGRTMSLITNLENLQQDIAIDLRDLGQRDAILAEARKLHAQMQQLAEAIRRNAPRDEVVTRYQQAYDVWRRFAASVRGVDSESVARDLFRIDQINGELHQLLWLKQPVDQATLVHLAKHLERGVDKMYRFIPLSAILSAPRPDEAMSATKEFRDLCRSLVLSAGKSGGLEDILWDFRLLEVEWQQIRSLVEPLDINGMDLLVVRVNWSVDALRAALQIKPALDRQTVTNLSASIDELAISLDQDLRRRIGSNRLYSAALRSQLLARSDAFHEAAHRLHEDVARGGRDDQLSQRCNAVAESWKQLATYLGQLNEIDRRSLGQTYEQIVPQVAKLQILLAY